MERAATNKAGSAYRDSPHDEARRLELAVSALPPEERGSVSVGPFSTD